VNTSPPNRGGLLESLRRAGESLFAMVRNRIELFTVELQEEKLRFLDLCVWLVVAALFGLVGFLAIFSALAIWLWCLAGYAGLVGLGIVTLVVAAIIVLTLRKHIKTGPTPFAQTVAEFRKDGECLKRSN
jgi:uncharacterized membrane protein YqjE